MNVHAVMSTVSWKGVIIIPTPDKISLPDYSEALECCSHRRVTVNKLAYSVLLLFVNFVDLPLLLNIHRNESSQQWLLLVIVNSLYRKWLKTKSQYFNRLIRVQCTKNYLIRQEWIEYILVYKPMYFFIAKSLREMWRLWIDGREWWNDGRICVINLIERKINKKWCKQQMLTMCNPRVCESQLQIYYKLHNISRFVEIR